MLLKYFYNYVIEKLKIKHGTIKNLIFLFIYLFLYYSISFFILYYLPRVMLI